MSSATLAAFDACPNREIASKRGDNISVCPKYPDGVVMDELYSGTNMFSDPRRREIFARSLGCISCPMKNKAVRLEHVREPFEGFHDAIRTHAKPQFDDGHYGAAVLTGTLVVRDRLRALTGFETASDAFGRGGLVIAGSANNYTDNNYQNFSKFIMMANDNIRNELAHTNDKNAHIKKPDIALQFLGNSSLSMFMLDAAEALTPRVD